MSNRADLNRGAAVASIWLAALLVAMKIWAAWSTGSTAMLGSLADSALDLVASLAMLAGVWVAAMPADERHRFGHGKAEALAAMFQVMLISISVVAISARAIERFLSGARTEAAASGIIVSLVAMGITLGLLAWQRHVIRQTGSLAIATDHIHYQSDLLLNAAVIAALVLDQLAGFASADPLLGLAIAAWLGWSAWRAAGEAIDQPMDREWPAEKKERLLSVIASNPDLHGVHDLRTRTSGNQDFAQFHVWVDPNMTVRQAHRVMDDIEARLHAEFPDVEILIHTDPDGLVDEEGIAAADVLPTPEDMSEGSRAGPPYAG